MTQTRQIFGVLVIVAMLLGGFVWAEALPTSEGTEDHQRLGTQVRVTPQGVHEGTPTYKAQLIVSDLAAGEVLLAPTIVFLSGEPAEVRSSTDAETFLEFRVEVVESPDGATASYQFEMRRADTVLTSQSATFEL